MCRNHVSILYVSECVSKLWAVRDCDEVISCLAEHPLQRLVNLADLMTWIDLLERAAQYIFLYIHPWTCSRRDADAAKAAEDAKKAEGNTNAKVCHTYGSSPQHQGYPEHLEHVSSPSFLLNSSTLSTTHVDRQYVLRSP